MITKTVPIVIVCTLICLLFDLGIWTKASFRSIVLFRDVLNIPVGANALTDLCRMHICDGSSIVVSNSTAPEKGVFRIRYFLPTLEKSSALSHFQQLRVIPLHDRRKKAPKLFAAKWKLGLG